MPYFNTSFYCVQKHLHTLWVINYFSPYRPFSTDETLHVYHYSTPISMEITTFRCSSRSSLHCYGPLCRPHCRKLPSFFSYSIVEILMSIVTAFHSETLYCRINSQEDTPLITTMVTFSILRLIIIFPTCPHK